MRTFIAVPLPDECHRMIRQILDRMHSFRSEVRWSSIHSIHLTLKFLGEIDPASLPRLASVLKQQAVVPGFSLTLRGLGVFPNPKNPRVVWCGISDESGGLAALQAAVEAACESLGFGREERPFHPHLTLGRVQGKKNLQPLMDYIRIGSGLECPFRADDYQIYQSVLSPRGAVYTVLDKIDLLRQI
jgi:RNA 2',3'-cyclic 3'-phosphodiesterase